MSDGAVMEKTFERGDPVYILDGECKGIFGIVTRANQKDMDLRTMLYKETYCGIIIAGSTLGASFVDIPNRLLEKLDRTQSRLAAMTALAKEMQERLCDEWCGDAFEVARDGHSGDCFSFQQRIKEIEENQ